VEAEKKARAMFKRQEMAKKLIKPIKKNKKKNTLKTGINVANAKRSSCGIEK